MSLQRDISGTETPRWQALLGWALMGVGLVLCLRGPSKPQAPAAQPRRETRVSVTAEVVALDGKPLHSSALGLDLSFPSVPLQRPFILTVKGQGLEGTAT